jgi:protein-disulfide isomerase/uncharacterized membrane protein
MSLFIKLLGLVNAGYLLSIHGSKACAVGQSCSEVLSSVYASFFGVPLAAVGVSLYLVLLALELFHRTDQLPKTSFQNATLAVLTPSAAVGIVLMIIQWTQLHAFCPFCLLNSVLLVGLFYAYFRTYEGGFSFQLSVSQWLSIALLVALPMSVSKAINLKQSVNHVLATIGGEEVTLGQFKRSDFKTRYLDLQSKMNQLKKQYVNQKVLEIEAKKYDLSLNNYIQAKVIQNIAISEQEMRDFYEEKKEDVPGKTFEQVRTPIRNYLTRKKEDAIIQAHIKTLAKAYNVEYKMDAAEKIVVRKNAIQTHAKGPKNAPIKIIEFADMQCSHCKEAYAELKPLLNKYKDNIYFEYRHYPLPGNRFSKAFAKGSYCAGEAGQFFEFIELSFANQKKLGDIKPEDLAKKLGLDATAFDACMAGHRAQKALEQDIKEAERIGIQSTPTFIMNGQLFIGGISEDDIELML